MPQPARYDIKAVQGANLLLTMQFLTSRDPDTPLSLANHSAFMQVRKTLGDSTTLLDLGTDDRGGLQILDGGTTGKVQISVSATQMDLDIAYNSKVFPQRVNYCYDLKVVDSSGFVINEVQGVFILTAEVTRG